MEDGGGPSEPGVPNCGNKSSPFQENGLPDDAAVSVASEDVALSHIPDDDSREG